MSIGSRLRELRLHRNISLTDLAKEIGVTTGQLSHIEKDRSFPSMENLIMLADILGCDLNYLFQDELNVPPVTFSATPTEQHLIEKYRCLNKQNQNMIKMLMDYLFKEKIKFDENELDKVTELPSILNNNYKEGQRQYYIVGDAMYPIINDGDVVLTEDTSILNDGELGIFKVKDRYIIRRFHKNYLEAANTNFEEIKLNNKNKVKTVGRVLCKI